MDYSTRTIQNWCKALGIGSYRRYIKPKPIPRHYISRLVMDEGSTYKMRATVSRTSPWPS